MHRNPFSEDELAGRLVRVRTEMATLDLDIALISTPENIFYLTGLDHWGYFAPHLLVVPADGQMTLITRAMERVSVTKQVHNALFEGHQDNETAADIAIRLLDLREQAKTRGRAVHAEIHDLLREQGAGGREGCRRIGVETWSSGHAYGFGKTLRDGIEDAEWHDITGLVDRLRLVKSPAEQEMMRAAAAVTDAATGAALAAIGDGAAERDVAAECVAAMIRAGGETPGFGPFIRPGSRLGEEHGTWGAGSYSRGEPVFLELSGCVSRYHAPLGRLVHLGEAPAANRQMAAIASDAFEAVLGALRPGVLARDVYAAWQQVVDEAGLPHYRRHHCGYCVGIGFPPSWTGGNTVTGLRHDSNMEIREGMSFHILSWLMGTGQGDFFLSNTVLLGPDGAEVLTRTPAFCER